MNCIQCEEIFQPTDKHVLFCSNKCSKAFNKNNNTCFYCLSKYGDTRDHVTPHSASGYVKRKFSGLELVPACRECNTTLQDDYPFELDRRIDLLIERTIRRYGLNQLPAKWTLEELLDLGPTLQSAVMTITRYPKERRRSG